MSFDEEHLDDHYLCQREVAERDQRIRELEELRDRVYMRLQCADVPRDPWHWEVSTMLVTPNTALAGSPSSDERLQDEVNTRVSGFVAELRKAETAKLFVRQNFLSDADIEPGDRE